MSVLLNVMFNKQLAKQIKHEEPVSSSRESVVYARNRVSWG